MKEYIFDISIRDFVKLFNFVSKILYVIETDSLEDSLLRRITEKSPIRKDLVCLREFYAEKFDKNITESEIDFIDKIFTMSYNNYRTDSDVFDYFNRYKNKLIFIIFNDNIMNVCSTKKLKTLFKETMPVRNYILLSKDFKNFETSEKIKIVTNIFEQILTNFESKELNNDYVNLLSSIFANLLYENKNIDKNIYDIVQEIMNNFIALENSYIHINENVEQMIKFVDYIENVVYDSL